MSDSILSEFVEESVNSIANLPSITKKSLKSIETLDKLCLKLSNRIEILSTDLKTKDHDKHEEIKTLRLLIEALFQKRIAITSSNHDLINQHMKFLEQLEHSIDDVIDSCDPNSKQNMKTRKSKSSSSGSHTHTVPSRHIHHNPSTNASFLSPGGGVGDDSIPNTTTHSNNNTISSSTTPTPQKRKLSHRFHGNQYTTFKSTNNNINTNTTNKSENEPLYCTCREVAYGDMIACDNESCKIEWFHYACVGLDKSKKTTLSKNNESWLCQQCSSATTPKSIMKITSSSSSPNTKKNIPNTSTNNS